MNLLSEFERLFDAEEKGVARVIEIRNHGLIVGQTSAGAIILLKGKAESGKQYFYDRRTNTILSPAPEVVFSEYGV